MDEQNEPMSTKKKSIGKKISESHPEQVSFSVAPGTKVKITLDVGEQIVDGKVSLTLHIEQVVAEQTLVTEVTQAESIPAFETATPVITPDGRWAAWEGLKSRVKTY